MSETMSVRDCLIKQAGDPYDGTYCSVIRSALTVLDRAGIRTALELQQTPPVFLLHFWGCKVGTVRFMNRRLRQRFGSGFTQHASWLEGEDRFDSEIHHEQIARIQAESLEAFKQWRPGLLEKEKVRRIDEIAANRARREQAEEEARLEALREAARERKRREQIEEESGSKLQARADKPKSEITYREWLIGQLAGSRGSHEQPETIVALADGILRVLIGGVPDHVIPVDGPVKDLPEWPDLTVRGQRVVTAWGVKSLRALAQLTSADMLKIKNVGWTTINELRVLLKKYGLALKDDHDLPTLGR